MLLLFLPALPFWEAMTSSLQEIRRNLRGIVLMSTALVILTAAAVAATAHAMGLPCSRPPTSSGCWTGARVSARCG